MAGEGAGYRMTPVNAEGSDPWVDFMVAEPADVHEGMLRFYVSRAAWISQGSPPEVFVTMTATMPVPREAPV